ncbi:hypothetical protein BGX33_010285 [Mortierella sp. NVP41]|nr:hypothetical protein BGX33_010285 [Mortierella sp. NVP41]
MTGKHDLLMIEHEVIAYLALAAQARLRVLLERMIHASRHRERSLATLNPPMYDLNHAMFRIGISQDVKKQLLAVERVEREEELKRKERIAERERRLAKAAEDGLLDENGIPRGAAGGPDGEIDAKGLGAKGKAKKTVRFRLSPKPKKENKVVLTEEEKWRLTNQTALRSADSRGKTTYAWMAAGTSGVLKRPVKPTDDPTTAGSSSSSSPGPETQEVKAAAGSEAVLGMLTADLRDSASRKVTIKDVLFCLEHDLGGEGSGQKVLTKWYIL